MPLTQLEYAGLYEERDDENRRYIEERVDDPQRRIRHRMIYAQDNDVDCGIYKWDYLDSKRYAPQLFDEVSYLIYFPIFAVRSHS